MTNWCLNLLEVEGAAEDIAAFRDVCFTAHGDLGFEKLVPIPDIVKGTHSGSFTALGLEAALGAAVLTQSQDHIPLAMRGNTIFERELAIKAGIDSYERLAAWLQRHHPQAIDLGARTLEAYRQTGSWTESTWKDNNWGTNRVVDQSILKESATRLDVHFNTPWSTADRIYHEMARRFPRLSITVSAIETGNEFSYRFTSRDGEIKVEEPGLTTAFIEYVERESRDQSIASDFYLPAAVLQSEPRTDALHWLARRRLKQALDGYPVYDPPHEGIEMLMSEEQAHANFDYFLVQRGMRIGYLRNFLARFGVLLDSTEPSKIALDCWLAKYGAFLTVREKGSSYLTRRPAWIGPRQGLNVIHDLAVFLGEFAIKESSNLYWEMYVDVPEGLRKESEDFQKPVIGGLPHNSRWRFYPHNDLHRICHALREGSYLWKRPMMSVSPRALYSSYFSLMLRKMRLLARGDVEGADAVMREPTNRG